MTPLWQAYRHLPRHERREDGLRYVPLGAPFPASDRIAADVIGRTLSPQFVYCRSMVSQSHDTVLPREEAWWRKEGR